MCYEDASDLQTISTCQLVVRVRLVEFSERHDKRAALLQLTAGCKCYGEVANLLIISRQQLLATCYEKASDSSDVSGVSVASMLQGSWKQVDSMLRTCYEEVKWKLLSWNLGYVERQTGFRLTKTKQTASTSGTLSRVTIVTSVEPLSTGLELRLDNPGLRLTELPNYLPCRRSLVTR